MTGARFVHDTLERLGWEVLIADAQKVKGRVLARRRRPPLPRGFGRENRFLVAHRGVIASSWRPWAASGSPVATDGRWRRP